MPIKRGKTEVLNVSLPKSTKEELVKLSRERGESVSQVVSSAVFRFIFLTRWRAVQKALAPTFKKLGIKTEDDVERYFG